MTSQCSRNLRLFEIALVLVRFDHVARRIANANQGIMCPAVMLRVSDCVGDSVSVAIPQPNGSTTPVSSSADIQFNWPALRSASFR